MTTQSLLEGVMLLIPLMLSLGVHEWAHAYSARLLGDDTAQREGRLTLNPIAHIDPIGTLLLPLLGVPFGWARPVPVNPLRFTRKVTMRFGMLLTAAAGPLSNLVLAVLSTASLAVLSQAAPSLLAGNSGVWFFLSTGVLLNLSLAAFNLLPIPPLDGSRIVDGLIPYRWRAAWESYSRYGALLLVAVIVLPRVTGLDPFSWLHWCAIWLIQLAI